jgi:hypothetical protein
MVCIQPRSVPLLSKINKEYILFASIMITDHIKTGVLSDIRNVMYNKYCHAIVNSTFSTDCSCIASGRTAKKTLLPTVLSVLRDVTETRSPLHCLATCVFAEPFPNNGHLCWFHNSGFQQTCYNVLHTVGNVHGCCL